MGDRIIEATMKQGLPAWMGMDGGLPFASVQSKTPAFSRERKGKAETVRFVMRRESSFLVVVSGCLNTTVDRRYLGKVAEEEERVKAKIDTPLSRNQEIYRIDIFFFYFLFDRSRCCLVYFE